MQCSKLPMPETELTLPFGRVSDGGLVVTLWDTLQQNTMAVIFLAWALRPWRIIIRCRTQNR